MSGKKIILAVLMGLALLATVAGGLYWNLTHYVMVDWKLYPRDADSLDFRQETISVSHYEKLAEALPECVIHWNVPFQGETYPENVESLTVTALSESDLPAFAYLTDLKVLDAESCTDYALLSRLSRNYPDLEVRYSVTFSDGTVYPQSATEVRVSAVTEDDVHLLDYLPRLERVTVEDAESMDNMATLCGTAHNLGLEFGIVLGGRWISDEETALELTGLTAEQTPMLQLLGMLERLYLLDPQMGGEELLALREQYPHVRINWEVELFGRVFRDDTTEVDLSQVEIGDLGEVEQALEVLPGAEKVILGLCGLDKSEWDKNKKRTVAVCPIANEDVAAFRDRVRENYKVVWSVRLGPDIVLRTDADNFMPGHFNVGRLFTDHAYNLRYCEDMVTLDIGHMTLRNIDFVEFMPKLRHLILAWTEVQYIEPIRNCKELVFLEVDNSTIRDFSPLVDCTALEDLNIGGTYPKVDPVLEMTWLKNLYMVRCNSGDVYKATETLTNTNVVTGGTITVGNGWRKLQNYYDMRDNLGVPYMNG